MVGLASLLALAVTTASLVTAAGQCENVRYENKTRVFIMTDISNEPDDQMSLVRLLTHSNELDIVNIAVVTSTWKNDSIDLKTTFDVINAYGNVVDNLNSNVPAAGVYPPVDDILGKVVAGHAVYGLAAFDEPTPSNASKALIAAVDASEQPLWVLAWGGANVLAESLNVVEASRSEADVAAFVGKLRVHSISDQDDSGPWIRTLFPKLFYIVSIHGFSEYGSPTWIGISGEAIRHFDKGGPDSTIISNEWLQTNIRIGAFGSDYYPLWEYQMEGDTPSFLAILPNGLNEPEHPEWGGWGGRYIPADASGSTGLYSDAMDWVIGMNNDTFFSKYASIWRWRQAFQFDFAARMGWTVNAANTTDDGSTFVGSANHHPVVVVNGSCGTLQLPYVFGESIVLDASESWDPDGDELSYDWFHYREVTMRLEGDIPRNSANVTFTPLDTVGALTEITPNDNITMHIILTVADSRDMPLVAYRRIILTPAA